MKGALRLSASIIVLWFLAVPPVLSLAMVATQDVGEEEPILVGRMAHVEGSVFRYVPEEGDWVQTMKDAPFGLEDKLRSDGDSRAEIILPNNTVVRMGQDTHLQLLSLQNDGTEINMIHGVVRLYNKGTDTLITVTTPFGTVQAPAQTSFDLTVSETSVEVISIKGSVFYFKSDADKVGTEVTEGSTPLVADRYTVTAGTGYSDPDWDGWNLEREALWARRIRSGGRSAKYLPSGLHDHAYVLDDYGRWERVYYDGAYGYFWRPIYVSPSWAPFSVGSWTLWYGDPVWIPGEPFGYVTHHYGSWAYVGGYWRWAPPVNSYSVHFAHPHWSIGFAWYPGRVGWFHSGLHIGWFPLGPREPYYCYRRWGPRSAVSRKRHRAKVHHDRGYKHSRHAVVIKRGHLYATDNYRNIRVKDIDHSKMVGTHKPGMGFDQKGAHRGRNKEQYAFKGVATGRKFHSPMEKGSNREPATARMRRSERDNTIGNEKKRGSPSANKRDPAGSLKKRRDTARAPGAGAGPSQGRLEGKGSRTNRWEPPSTTREGQEDRRGKGTQQLARNSKGPAPVSSRTNRTDRRQVRTLPQGSSVSGGTPVSAPRQSVRRYDGERAGPTGKQKNWEAGKTPGRANAQPTRNWGTASETKSWRSPYNTGKSRRGQRPSGSPSRSFSRNNSSNRSRGR